MKSKQEKYRLIPKLIVLINAVFIVAMIFLNRGVHHATTGQEPCGHTKEISADAINFVSIKLM